MTPDVLAALHTRAFTVPRPWDAAEFAALLESPYVFVTGDARAFAMGRVIADEAELLTIATAPDHRRKGLGHDRMTAFLTEARNRKAQTAFLEVAADNIAAIALYASHGFTQAGTRKSYYRAPTGTLIDALVMTRSLL